MSDVYISLARLETMSTQLGAIVKEFEKAGERSGELQEAIGRPFGRSELQDAADDFEGRWDLEREELKKGLSDVRDHLDAVIAGTEEWDSETAIALEGKE